MKATVSKVGGNKCKIFVVVDVDCAARGAPPRAAPPCPVFSVEARGSLALSYTTLSTLSYALLHSHVSGVCSSGEEGEHLTVSGTRADVFNPAYPLAAGAPVLYSY